MPSAGLHVQMCLVFVVLVSPHCVKLKVSFNNLNCFLFSGNSLNPVAAETLNQVALPIVPFDTCKRMDYWWFQVKTSMICCGYTLPDELKSVCQVE